MAAANYWQALHRCLVGISFKRRWNLFSHPLFCWSSFCGGEMCWNIDFFTFFSSTSGCFSLLSNLNLNPHLIYLWQMKQP
jgi:hypothetical protein